MVNYQKSFVNKEALTRGNNINKMVENSRREGDDNLREKKIDKRE